MRVTWVAAACHWGYRSFHSLFKKNKTNQSKKQKQKQNSTLLFGPFLLRHSLSISHLLFSVAIPHHSFFPIRKNVHFSSQTQCYNYTLGCIANLWCIYFYMKNILYHVFGSSLQIQTPAFGPGEFSLLFCQVIAAFSLSLFTYDISIGLISDSSISVLCGFFSDILRFYATFALYC